VAAGLVFAGTVNAADDFKKPKVAPRGFLSKFLAPRMDSRLDAEVSAAANFVNPAANPWTRDEQTVSRVQRSAIQATKGAVKRYAIESLGIDAWSLPLMGAKGTGLDALRTDSGGTRLRFGFSHRAPRAEVLVPVSAGRVAFSADAMGRIGTSFETPNANLRFGATIDARAHEGTFGLTCRF
jgi:hypothetical protein